MCTKAVKSPYLIPGRLERVLAAIQILGSYGFASRQAKSWAGKLETINENDDWHTVFLDHPEFFRVGAGDWVSLRWRHGYEETYRVSERRELTHTELQSLPTKDKENDVTRKPLEPDEIATLMNIAVELHGRTIAQEQERRWLSSFLFPLLGAVLGGIVGASATALLK